MNILLYLKQPFPKAKNKWRNIILISLFVSLFLFIFQPFGIGRMENSLRKFIFIGGFGLVSLIILIVDLIIIERIFQGFFKEKNWYLYKELLWLFFIVFTIGLGNLTYTVTCFEQRLTLSYIIKFEVVTFAIATFPISIFTISKNNYLLHRHKSSANKLNNILKGNSINKQKKQSTILYSYNERDKMEFDINNLYYIESKGNNIELNLFENNHITKRTIRNTLKKSLEYLADSPDLVQCHRAFIVNLNKVTNVKGNSQGLVLQLSNCDTEVPVSRSYVKDIKDKLC